MIKRIISLSLILFQLTLICPVTTYANTTENNLQQQINENNTSIEKENEEKDEIKEEIKNETKEEIKEEIKEETKQEDNQIVITKEDKSFFYNKENNINTLVEDTPTTFASVSHTESNYNGTIKYESSTGDLVIRSYATKGALAVPRFSTIGYIMRFYNSETKQSYATQVYAPYVGKANESNTKNTIGFYREENYTSNNIVWTTDRMNLATLEAIFKADFGTSFSTITGYEDIIISYDSIFSIKEPYKTVVNVEMGSDRKIDKTKEHYKTFNGKHAFTTSSYKVSKAMSESSGWITTFDTAKKGINGARSWSGVDFTTDFNQSVTILGAQKPKVSKKVNIKYINEVSGESIADSTSSTYSVDAKGISKTFSAKTVTNYKYSYYKVDLGSGLSAKKTGSSATITVSASNSKHEIIFYYKPSFSEKTIVVNAIDKTKNRIISTNEYIRNVTSDTTFSATRPILSNYEYDYHETVIDSIKSSPSILATANITLKVSNNSYEINFYYNQKSSNSVTPSGSIAFTPSSSGWQNSNISVTASVTGDTEITQIGYQSRSFYYYTSDWIPGYYEKVKNDKGELVEVWVPGEWGDTYITSSSVQCSYIQVWQIDKLSISCLSATDVNGNATSASLSAYTISNGGSVNIQSEASDIVLSASLTGWKEKSKAWSSESAPYGGWWIDSIGIYVNTDKPTETYYSTSGSFYLDKTNPALHSATYAYTEWRNKDIDISLTYSDNLSDLDSNSYIVLKDSSHYKNDNIYLSKDFTNINYNKINYASKYTLENDGIYSLTYNLIDNAGNKISGTKSSYKLDKTAPNDAVFSDDGRTYIDSDLEVQIELSDNLSGVAKAELVILSTSEYNDEEKLNLNLSTRENIDGDTTTYKYTINKNGTYYFHVWTYDRAGNVTYNVSEGYKYFKINSDDIVINPYANVGKVMRGTRFDIISTIDKFTEEDFENSEINYKMPNWIVDDIDKKANGRYYASLGFGSDSLAKDFTDDVGLKLWNSYTVPYGAILTYNRDGVKTGVDYKVEVVLNYTNYVFGEKKTRIVIKNFGVIPEQIIKTQIIYNK